MGFRSAHRPGNNGYWWLSNKNDSHGVYKAPCPYKTFSMMGEGTCDSEEWRIEAVGKSCGEKVEYKDQVTVLGLRNGKYIGVGVGMELSGLLSSFSGGKIPESARESLFSIDHDHHKDIWTIYAKNGGLA